MAYNQTVVVLGGLAHIPIAIGAFYLVKAFMYRGGDGKIAPFSFSYRLAALRRKAAVLGESSENPHDEDSPDTSGKPTSKPKTTIASNVEDKIEGNIESKGLDP